MGNEENYLDNLLNSIGQKKSDVKKASNEEKRRKKEQIAKENSIKPEDDFMKATGLDTYTPKPLERENLKKAFSEKDFLSEFEDELSDGRADDFIKQFDAELDSDNDTSFSDSASSFFDIKEGSRNLSSDDSTNSFDESISPDSSGDDLIYEDLPSKDSISTEEEKSVTVNAPSPTKERTINNIDDIVKNAKRQVENSPSDIDSSNDNLSSSEDETNSVLLNNVTDIASDNSSVPNVLDSIELPSDFDLNDTSAKEVPLMDEAADTGDDSDLSALLGAGSDFSDLGDMLSADENQEELPESRDSFEQSASDVSSDPFADGQNDDISLDDMAEEKPNFFSNIISKVKGIFSKSSKEEPEESDSKAEASDVAVDIAPKNPTTEELIAEDQDLLKEFGELPEEDKAAVAEQEKKAEEEKKEEKKKKKKEKKEKPPKEKKEKPKKEPKPKKEKAPDNSPKIPAAAIAVNAILAISIGLFVIIFSNALSHRDGLSTAKEKFDNGDYHEAYVLFSGLKLSENDAPYLEKSKILSTLSISYNEYFSCMTAKKYDMALDALIKGVHYYNLNKPLATKLGIDSLYDALGNDIVNELSKYGISAEDAENLYGEHTRVVYTKKVDDILSDLGYKNGENHEGGTESSSSDGASSEVSGSENASSDAGNTDGAVDQVPENGGTADTSTSDGEAL